MEVHAAYLMLVAMVTGQTTIGYWLVGTKLVEVPTGRVNRGKNPDWSVSGFDSGVRRSFRVDFDTEIAHSYCFWRWERKRSGPSTGRSAFFFAVYRPAGEMRSMIPAGRYPGRGRRRTRDYEL